METVGSVLFKSGLAGEWTHRKDTYSLITGQAVVTDQQGSVPHGMFTAPLGKNESFIGVIGMDNSSLYIADQDGLMVLRIINDDLDDRDLSSSHRKRYCGGRRNLDAGEIAADYLSFFHG